MPYHLTPVQGLWRLNPPIRGIRDQVGKGGASRNLSLDLRIKWTFGPKFPEHSETWKSSIQGSALECRCGMRPTPLPTPPHTCSKTQGGDNQVQKTLF